MNIKAHRTLASTCCLTAAIVAATSVTAALEFNFDRNSMSGWHNRVWDPAAGDGNGAWVDLESGRYRMPTTINGRKIYPADAYRTNSLFCSSKDAWPNERGRGSYLTPIATGFNSAGDSPLFPSPNTGLDTGTNTKWARSPKFRITEPGDIVFKLAWGKNDALAEPTGESDIPPVAVAANGWTGVALRDDATGAFVLTQRGTQINGSFGESRFTEQQLAAAGVTAEKRYTLELITTRAGAESWIALDDVSIPGVLDDDEVHTLYWDFSDDDFQGWRNRVWDAAADNGLGRWVDLEPGVTAMPESINDGQVWPTNDAANALVCCSARGWPYDQSGTGSYLVPIHLDAGTNTKWARSPEFFITQMRDISFDLFYGPRTEGQLGHYESQVQPEAFPRSQGGAAVLALRDAETGKFVALAEGSTSGDQPTRRTFDTNVLAKIDRSHAYTLDLIINRGAGESWMALDNVSVPGRLAAAFMTSFSVQGHTLRPTGDMVWVAPRGTDVTALAPTFTLGAGATCDVESGTVRDFTSPQTYTVTLPTGESHAFRLTVQVASRFTVPVAEGLVFHVSADQGVATRDGAVTRWIDLCGGTDLYPYLFDHLPTYVAESTPGGLASVHFTNSFSTGEKIGQALAGCGAWKFPCGASNRTVFVFERYNYSTPPELHGWGGFTYGFTPNSLWNREIAEETSVFGLVATLNDGKGSILSEQTLGIEGWGVGMDFKMDAARPGNEWICHSATYAADGTLKSFMNGEEKLNRTGVAYNTGRTLVAMGMEIDGNPFQNMDVCEVLVYDRVLSDEERLSVEDYLQRHWVRQSGLTVIVR